MGTLAAFAMVCLSVIWLRRVRPDLPREFKTPFYPVTPVLGILSCLFLITRVEEKVLHFFGWFMAAVVVLYFAYGYWRSPMAKRAAAIP